MKCSKFRKAVIPLMMETRDEEELALSLARTDLRLRTHLDSCEACKSYIRSCQEAINRLGSIEVEEPSELEWERVRRAIRKSVREEAPVYRIVWPRLAQVSWARVGTVAAIVLLLFVGSLFYFRPQQIDESFPPELQLTRVLPDEELSLAFLDEMDEEDRECDKLISEIDALISEIDTAYTQLDISREEVLLEGNTFGKYPHVRRVS